MAGSTVIKFSLQHPEDIAAQAICHPIRGNPSPSPFENCMRIQTLFNSYQILRSLSSQSAGVSPGALGFKSA